jgi:hypothetical protein
MKATKLLFQVERKEIHYIQSTLESYDGMAVVRTADPGRAVIEVRVAPGCEPLVLELIDDLKTRERIEWLRL